MRKVHELTFLWFGLPGPLLINVFLKVTEPETDFNYIDLDSSPEGWAPGPVRMSVKPLFVAQNPWFLFSMCKRGPRKGAPRKAVQEAFPTTSDKFPTLIRQNPHSLFHGKGRERGNRALVIVF